MDLFNDRSIVALSDLVARAISRLLRALRARR